MLFNILTGPNYSYNALKSGNPLARERQTQAEHDELLDPRNLPDYYDLVLAGMPPAALKAAAEIREAESPKYWNDPRPRRPIQSSSSWVQGLQYDPISQILTMNGYSCAATPEDVQKILEGNYLSGNGSVGRSLMNLWRTKGTGKNSGLGALPR